MVTTFVTTNWNYPRERRIDADTSITYHLLRGDLPVLLYVPETERAVQPPSIPVA